MITCFISTRIRELLLCHIAELDCQLRTVTKFMVIANNHKRISRSEGSRGYSAPRIPRLSGTALRPCGSRSNRERTQWNLSSLVPSTAPSTYHLPFIFIAQSCEGTTFHPRSFNAGQGEGGLRLAQPLRAAQISLPLCHLEPKSTDKTLKDLAESGFHLRHHVYI